MQMHIMQMLECIVNQDILLDYNTDDLRNTVQFIREQKIRTCTLEAEEELQGVCMEFVSEVLVPYMQRMMDKPRFVGDRLFGVKHGLKCLSTIVLHLSKERKQQAFMSVKSNEPFISVNNFERINV